MTEHDSAILSAFRDEFTKKENYERNRELKARLLERGYGVTKVAGSYIENFQTPKAMEVSEESFFVSNRKDDPQFIEVISGLGESVGSLKMGEESEFMSRVSGRPVTFSESLETYENLSRNSKWAVKKLVERLKGKKQG